MPFVEQNTIIEAPIDIVMAAMNDVENIPSWATVDGTIDNVKGSGPGMTYEWHYTITKMSFNGKSEVLEQTEDMLITKTSGDVESIWTINLTPIGNNYTTMQVVVEYSPPHIFVELLADLVMQQLNDPQVARENMARFKKRVEQQAKVALQQPITP